MLMICVQVSGSTSAPLTTEFPCWDTLKDCPERAAFNCHDNGENCPLSCGLCPGMTPHVTNTCYDLWPDCPELAEKDCHGFGDKCCLSCGLGNVFS